MKFAGTCAHISATVTMHFTQSQIAKSWPDYLPAQDLAKSYYKYNVFTKNAPNSS